MHLLNKKTEKWPNTYKQLKVSMSQVTWNKLSHSVSVQPVEFKYIAFYFQAFK